MSVTAPSSVEYTPTTTTAGSKVVVTDVQMPFASMVVFMVKWALASIPAFLILAVLSFVVFLAVGALGTASHSLASRSALTSTENPRAYVTEMKSDLRNLVTAEEAYFSDSSAYTANMSLLPFRASPGNVIGRITTGAGYWSATVSNSMLPGSTCGIGVNTTNPIVSTAFDGEPSCYVP